MIKFKIKQKLEEEIKSSKDELMEIKKAKKKAEDEFEDLNKKYLACVKQKSENEEKNQCFSSVSIFEEKKNINEETKNKKNNDLNEALARFVLHKS